MAQQFNLFLSRFRIDKNSPNADKIPKTHSGLGKNKGIYSIPKEKKTELLNIMSRVIFKEPLDLTELNVPNTCIKIDLDFRFPVDKVLIKNAKRNRNENGNGDNEYIGDEDSDNNKFNNDLDNNDLDNNYDIYNQYHEYDDDDYEYNDFNNKNKNEKSKNEKSKNNRKNINDTNNTNYHRKFDLHMIKDFVKCYNNSIKKYIDLEEVEKEKKGEANNHPLEAFIMMRDSPYKDPKSPIIKDGIHIMYPYLICDYNIQELIRLDALKNCGSIIYTIPDLEKEPVDKIIDKKVIQESGWMMYGCSKPNTAPYDVKYILDEDGNELDNKYTKRQLLELLSIRDYKEDTKIYNIHSAIENVLIEHKNSKVKKEKKKQEMHRKIENGGLNALSKMNSPSLDDDLLDSIRTLLSMLSDDRAYDYSSWIQVGFCLFNINPRLYNEWVEFSKRCPEKFDEDECMQRWYAFKHGTLSLGSLHLWAKSDNPSEYKIFQSNNIRSLILKSVSETTTDIAKVIYELYKFSYKYVPSRKGGHGAWYQFENHRWHYCAEAISLINAMSNEVFKHYLDVIANINVIVKESESEETIEQNLTKLKPLQSISYKLRDIGNKNKYLAECRLLFSDSTFETKLDANPYLLGFNNGIYDLALGIFRAGVPEDYVSMSTGIDYIKFPTDHPDIEYIHEFFTQIFVDADARKYILTLTASMLEGGNAQEKFHVWTGVGGNGKSKLINLMEYTLGDYIKRVPTTVFTQDSKASGAANPEIARLKGARIATSQETEQNSEFNISVVKEMSTSDKIIARELFQNPVEFTMMATFVLCCNHKPSLPEDDEAVWRRMAILAFKSRFVDKPDPQNIYEFPRDYYITEKLQRCAPAFAYLLLEFYKDYKKNGIQEPECVRSATLEYRKSNDNIGYFITEKLIADSNSRVKLEELYGEFSKWWRESIGRNIPKKNDFKSLMEKRFNTKYSAQSGWIGWRINNNSEGDDSEPATILSQVILKSATI